MTARDKPLQDGRYSLDLGKGANPRNRNDGEAGQQPHADGTVSTDQSGSFWPPTPVPGSDIANQIKTCTICRSCREPVPLLRCTKQWGNAHPSFLLGPAILPSWESGRRRRLKIGIQQRSEDTTGTGSRCSTSIVETERTVNRDGLDRRRAVMSGRRSQFLGAPTPISDAVSVGVYPRWRYSPPERRREVFFLASGGSIPPGLRRHGRQQPMQVGHTMVGTTHHASDRRWQGKTTLRGVPCRKHEGFDILTLQVGRA